jgi:hypothetical protein
MTLSQLFDYIARALGIAFVVWMIWILVFPGQPEDAARTHRSRSAATPPSARPREHRIEEMHAPVLSSANGRTPESRRMTLTDATPPDGGSEAA